MMRTCFDDGCGKVPHKFTGTALAPLTLVTAAYLRRSIKETMNTKELEDRIKSLEDEVAAFEISVSRLDLVVSKIPNLPEEESNVASGLFLTLGRALSKQ